MISWHLYLHLSLNLFFTASVSLGYCEAPSEVTVRSPTGYCLLHGAHQFGCRTATAEVTFCSYELEQYKQGILKWWNNTIKKGKHTIGKTILWPGAVTRIWQWKGFSPSPIRKMWSSLRKKISKGSFFHDFFKELLISNKETFPYQDISVSSPRFPSSPGNISPHHTDDLLITSQCHRRQQNSLIPLQEQLSLVKKKKRKKGNQAPLSIVFTSLSWDWDADIANKNSPLSQRRMELLTSSLNN